MDDKNHQQATNAFVKLRRSPLASVRVDDPLCPQSISQGYDLQNLISKALEAEKGLCCGHKIGCTTEVMQKFLNINHPCAGRLYQNEVHTNTVTLKLSDFIGVGVECEIALRLGQDLSGQDVPFTKETVASSVSQVMAAAEIVDNRYQDFHGFGIPALIADDFFSGGAVLGEPHRLSGLDLMSAHGTTRIDGKDVGSGYGEAVMGTPLNALAWLANQKAERGELLKAGDVIMTGSVVETQWIDKPCVVTCSVAPLGEVQLTFV